MKLWIGFSVLMLPMLAFAQVVGTPAPQTVEEAMVLLPQLIGAISSGNHNVLGGIVLMVLMIGVKQYIIPKYNITSEMIPWVTALAGVLITVGYAMSQGQTLEQSFAVGLELALSAGGAWGLFGKALANTLFKGKLAKAEKVL